MPSRYAELDTDDERLPEGMTRVGYDADTQVYTFQDTDGSLWEGPPGARYGHLTKVSDAPKPPSNLDNIDLEGAEHADEPPPYHESEATRGLLQDPYTNGRQQGRWGGDDMARHWRAELMPLLNFFMILALFLLGVFWFLGWMTKSPNLSNCGPGSHAHQIQRGETCWSIAQMHEIGLDKLRETNDGINCDLLRVGAMICVPAMPKT